MSAKNRGTKTKVNDYYPTPEPVIDAIFNNIDWHLVRSFCEPCLGDGAIFNKLPEQVSVKFWYEIVKDKNYLNQSVYPPVGLTLTNPPFSLAKEFIETAQSHSETVIMLTRLNFLGSKNRLEFWKKAGLQQINVITPRPAFYAKCVDRKDSLYKACTTDLFPLDTKTCPYCNGRVRAQTDATEYAWLVFGDTSILKDDSPFRWLEI